MRSLPFLVVAASAVQAYWMGDIAHQGIASFNPDSSYQVFRNVKDFGAVGNGVADDTAAINAAISSGGRCGGNAACSGTTITPAVVYFPAGTYLISSSIIDYYYTQIIGDPTAMPVIKASANFATATTFGLLDGDQYGANGLRFGSTNVFYRQVRNLVFDTTAIPASSKAYGIHWPSSQATSIQNCVFKLSTAPGNLHTGIFVESGSGGLMNDLVFYGGMYGAQFGNQQYTTRNLTFYGSQTAINQLWDWGWTYKSINVVDCEVGINMTGPVVDSVTLIDSSFTNTGLAIVTNHNDSMPAQYSLVLENVVFSDVTTAVLGPNGVIVAGTSGSVTQQGFAQGNIYVPNGPVSYTGSNSAYFPRPPDLLSGSKYYERSKPQYDTVPVSLFMSARDYGATGDGNTDDTAALNKFFAAASASYSSGAVAFVDAGYYKVSDTVYIPPNIRIVGEALASVILGAGSKFSDINTPYPVVQVGLTDSRGYVEWSDMIVSTQGATAGAVLIEWNVNSPTGSFCKTPLAPSGMWDVHVRIGGFAGSNLQLAQCPTTPTQSNVINPQCIAAYMSMHITPKAGGLYMENNWLWTADHDIEDIDNTQITVFTGRGLLIESEGGRLWLVGTAVEHHNLYQYQLVNTRSIWMGQIQTETPYYQPNPPAPGPFTTVNAALSDPDFATDCASSLGLPGNPPCAMAWGLRVLGSQDVVVFGAGLYSFFNNYNTDCSDAGNGEVCQARISYFGPVQTGVPGYGVAGGWNNGTTGDVEVYNLNTIGSVSMITRDRTDVAFYTPNVAGFADTVAIFQY